jgi:hypothetical protein
MKLREEWDPRMRVGGSSTQTKPLSEVAKAAIQQLGAENGMVVDFPLLPDPRDPEEYPPIHTVLAVRPTPR